MHEAKSAYARLFAPPISGTGPSGLRTRPPAFVLRVQHLNGSVISPRSYLHVDLNLFDTGPLASASIAALTRAFANLTALGPARSQIQFSGVTRIDCADSSLDSAPLTLSLADHDTECSRATVEFLTPTELKHDGRVVEIPEFGILFNRIRDRLSTLRALYGNGPLPVDFSALGERAAAVRLDRSSLQQIHLTRRSSRTRQTHAIGGFAGLAQYSGPLTEFLPWLRAAEWTGVGRQTVWGKGHLRVTPFP